MTQTTTEIIETQRRTGTHAALATPEGFVSSRSVWTDEIWYLDAPGSRFRASDCALHWTGLSEGLETAFKALTWSLFVQRPKAKPLALSGAAVLGGRLRYLANWMAKRKYGSFARLTPAAIAIFRQDLIAELKARAKKRKSDYDTETIAHYLVLLEYVHEQQRHLDAVGVAGMPGEPFPGSSAWTVAEGIIPIVDSFVPALPDEVALTIARAAHRFIQEPAEDILKLAAACFRVRSMHDAQDEKLSEITLNRYMRRAVAKLSFSVLESEDAPWHASFDELAEASEKQRYSPKDTIRRLMTDLVAACTIVVRFQTGVRHGEMFTFKPGFRRNGLPLCVEVEPSLSGAYDLFFVKGIVSKGWDHPSDTRWLIGGRLAGSDTIPPAVRALQVICRLNAAWRRWSTVPETKDAFLIQFGFKGIPRSPDLITPLASETLSEHMKDFIVRWAEVGKLDGSDERLREYVRTKGRCVSSMQWRKTWANFVIRTDGRLLPAISQQFQHISTALTEEAYIGKDAMQLGIVESAAMERAVRYMRRALDGEPGVGGSMGRLMAEDPTGIRAEIAGLSGAEKDSKVRTWLTERDVRIWPSPHGKCFVGLLPGESRCHKLAGTSDFSNQTPNFVSRNPRLCSGCLCFGVDEEDLPFWRRRYVDNRRIWDEAVSRRMEAGYVVARERWVQSENVLKSLGVNVDDLEKEVADAAKAHA